VLRRGTPAFQREYDESQWYDRARLDRIQLAKLNALLRHAWAEVPFLNRYWRDAGVKPEPLAHVSELERYPILTKSLITANYDDMIAWSWRGKTLTKTTGGSSGTPFRLEYTMESYARRTAVMWRGYAWGGADLGTRTAYLWGTGKPPSRFAALKDRLYHRAFNRKFFNAFQMTDANLDEYAAEIEAFGAEVLVGYVAPVVTLARHLNRQGRTIAGVRGVITGAEALFEPERAEIERAFQCKVFNTYVRRRARHGSPQLRHAVRALPERRPRDLHRRGVRVRPRVAAARLDRRSHPRHDPHRRWPSRAGRVLRLRDTRRAHGEAVPRRADRARPDRGARRQGRRASPTRSARRS
jgi:hypothetical protein